MSTGPHAERLLAIYGELSPQLQLAARFVLDSPRDVALLSMREQARRAGVQPATMTRLAKQLGLPGFETLREAYVEALRAGGPGFSQRADRQVTDQKLKGDHALASEMASSAARQVGVLAEGPARDALAAAAGSIAGARRINCLGMRSSFPVAWYFHYVLSLVREGVVLVDGMAGVGVDTLRHAASDDVLLVTSVYPYTRATVEAVDYAASRGVRVVAITDSAVAPVAEHALQVVRITVDSPSFFHSMVPAFAAAEILASIVAGRGGANALATLEQAEGQLRAMNIHLDAPRRRRNE